MYTLEFSDLYDEINLTTSNLILYYAIYFLFTRGQFWPSGIVVACVCVCVCVSVCLSVCVSITCLSGR